MGMGTDRLDSEWRVGRVFVMYKIGGLTPVCVVLRFDLVAASPNNVCSHILNVICLLCTGKLICMFPSSREIRVDSGVFGLFRPNCIGAATPFCLFVCGAKVKPAEKSDVTFVDGVWEER